MHYLDHAATTPIPEAVAEEMYRVLREEFGNPNSQYSIGRRTRDLVAQARRTVAGALGCEAEQLCFTSCGTESDNWSIEAALWQNRHVGRHIITTAVEHNAILEPCRWLEQEGYEVTRLRPAQDGSITVEQVDGQADFYLLREARPNPEVNLRKKLSILWRPELAHIQELNDMPKYKEKSKQFVIDKIAEKIPGDILSKQISDTLFERDYNEIEHVIQEFKKNRTAGTWKRRAGRTRKGRRS